MSTQSFRHTSRATIPAPQPYFSAEPVTLPAPRLRRMTALEEMYAYWGSDQA